MNIKERFERWFKLRFAILYPFGIFTPLEKATDFNRWSLPLKADGGLKPPSAQAVRERSSLTGFTRLWANGYIIKLVKLTTSGPYAFVRHPLYLGTMLLAIGFIIMLKTYYIGVLFIILMAIVYYRSIKKEEVMLEEKFGDIYVNYKKKVPAILPTIFPYRKGEKWSYSFRRLVKSQEYKLFLWMIILVIAFHLKDEFMVEHEAVDAKIWGLIISAFILGIFDLIGEFIKGRNKKITVYFSCFGNQYSFKAKV